MKLKSKYSTYFAWAIMLCFVSLFAACGGSHDPFENTVNTTLIIGSTSPTPAPQKFIFNPQQEDGVGTLDAQVTQEFNDHYELEVNSFDVTVDFPGIGPIILVLDPAIPSTMTVYKLNKNNQIAGTHSLDLSFIVETPDQNLVYSNILLEGDNTSILTLVDPLPSVGFFFNGQSMVLNIPNLQVTLTPGLVQSLIDPTIVF